MNGAEINHKNQILIDETGKAYLGEGDFLQKRVIQYINLKPLSIFIDLSIKGIYRENVSNLPLIKQYKKWLLGTCEYHHLAESRGIKWRQTLISGNPNMVHQAGISVCDKVVDGKYVHPEDIEIVVKRT